MQLINYQDLSQDTLFILLDPSIMKVIHNGKMMLINFWVLILGKFPDFWVLLFGSKWHTPICYG